VKGGAREFFLLGSPQEREILAQGYGDTIFVCTQRRADRSPAQVAGAKGRLT